MKSSASDVNISDKPKSENREAAEEAVYSPFVETLTRLGLGVRGVIYLIMGTIAVQVVLGGRGGLADQQGVLAVIGSQPAGNIWLIVVMIGLAGYALWGIVRAIFDPLRLGHKLKGLMQRVWSLVSAWFYISLLIPTYGYLTGGAKAAYNGQQEDETQRSISAILTLPWGEWIVALLGILVIFVGLGQIYVGFSRKFEKQFELYELTDQQYIWIKRLGRFGIISRGLVFSITGIFLALAAYYSNPEKAQGIDGALLALAQQPFGFWLLGIVAVGLIAFGIYSLTGAAWFRLRR